MTDLISIQVNYVFNSWWSNPSSVTGLAQFSFMANSRWELASFLARPITRSYCVFLDFLFYHLLHGFISEELFWSIKHRFGTTWVYGSPFVPLNNKKKIKKVIATFHLTVLTLSCNSVFLLQMWLNLLKFCLIFSELGSINSNFE